MTDHTFSGAVQLAVTIQAVTHFQIPHRVHLLHGSDIAVTLGALEPGSYVGFVDKMRVVREPVDPFPIDGLFVLEGGPQRLRAWLASAHYLVAHKTLPYRRNSSFGTLVHIAMAEGALKANSLDVELV